jgi:hypothetical protein
MLETREGRERPCRDVGRARAGHAGHGVESCRARASRWLVGRARPWGSPRAKGMPGWPCRPRAAPGRCAHRTNRAAGTAHCAAPGALRVRRAAQWAPRAAPERQGTASRGHHVPRQAAPQASARLRATSAVAAGRAGRARHARAQRARWASSDHGGRVSRRAPREKGRRGRWWGRGASSPREWRQRGWLRGAGRLCAAEGDVEEGRGAGRHGRQARGAVGEDRAAKRAPWAKAAAAGALPR